MWLDVIKGLLVGICASAPLGPIAILVIQKSLSDGQKAGFLTGLGATLVDTVFAVIAIFALTVVQTFMGAHEVAVMIVGGIIVAGLGFGMIFRDPFRKMKPEERHSYSIGDFLQAVAMGLSNPGAIAVIFALFAFFGIEPEPKGFSVAPVLFALAGGSALYWLLFSWSFSRLRKNFEISTLLWISRIAGVVVMIIGIVLLAEGLMKVLFA